MTAHNASKAEGTGSQKGLALIFLSPLLLIYNPFFVLGGTAKFGMVGAILVLALVISPFIPSKKAIQINLATFVFLILYALIAARLNHLQDAAFRYSTTYLQLALCFSMYLTSILIVERIGIRTYASAMLLVFAVVCVKLLANITFLINPYGSSSVGDFTSDSYQQVSMVFGIVGIICIVRLGTWLKQRLFKFLLGLLISIVCVFVVLSTQARGEFLAFLVALLSVFFPRFFLGASIAGISSLSTLLVVSQNFDLPVLNRFKIALELGWEEPRVVLARESLNVLTSDPFVFMFGGGANYFQSYYGYSEGKYPHNFLLEAWLSGGILMVLVCVVLFLSPVIKAYTRLLVRQRVDKEIYCLAIYFLILALKSGSLNTNWVLAFAFPFFIALRSSMRRTQAAQSQTRNLKRKSNVAIAPT